MRLQCRLLWTSITGLAFLQGCGLDNKFTPITNNGSGYTISGSEPSPAPTMPPINSSTTFQSLRMNIFVPKCLGCHSGNNPPAGFSFDSYQETVRAVVPGNPTQSILLASVKNGSMPRGALPLSLNEVTNIEVWILLGAPND